MLFGKRSRHKPPPSRDPRPSAQAGLHRIDYEMMQKGAVVTRQGRAVRQFAVMIGGSIRLVTSGDTVDQATYDALVAAGAVAPLPEDAPPEEETPESEPPGPQPPDETPQKE